MKLRYPLLHGVATTVATGVVSFVPCVVLGRSAQPLLTWTGLLFLLPALLLQQLVLKYGKAVTADEEARRETIAGLVAGAALGLAWWT